MYLLRALLDALAPSRCGGCAEIAAAALCPACVEALHDAPLPAARIETYGGSRAALAYCGVARAALHAAKYGGHRGALHLLATVAAERLAPGLAGDAARTPRAVVPVPLGSRRRRHRGFNQAALAAAALAALPTGGPVLDGLRRCRETTSQVGLDAAARRGNVAAAFAWRGPSLGGGGVWLVDDVRTTGATFAAAARALQQGGAGRIEAVALAAVP